MTKRNILLAFVLNLSFAMFELIGGFFTNSIAIISDAMHDFFDALSIGISYFLEKKSKKNPDNKYTFGYTRYSVLGAIIMNSFFIIGSLMMVYHSILRLFNPVEVNYNGMSYLAILGIIINLLAAFFTRNGHSHNEKAVNLHMIEDVLGWIIVFIGSIVIKFTKLNIIDSILSLIVSIFIFVVAIKSLKKVLEVILEKIPDDIDIDKLKKHLKSIKNISDIHHIHVWSMDGINNYLTMHVVINNSNFEEIKLQIKNELKKLNIMHSTIEFESKDYHCENEKCHIDVFENTHCHHHH